jgi:hypothetical protein
MENVVRFSFILRLHYYIGFLFFMKIWYLILLSNC